MTVCKLPMAEFKCIQICGIFHSSLYFISCISENHLRFAYMIHFPFLVIKKTVDLQSSQFPSQKSQEESFGVFPPFSLPPYHKRRRYCRDMTVIGKVISGTQRQHRERYTILTQIPIVDTCWLAFIPCNWSAVKTC